MSSRLLSGEVHIHIHCVELVAVIRELTTALRVSNNRQETELAEIDDKLVTLGQRVAAMGDVEQSAVTTLTTLKAEFDAAVASAANAGATPAQLQAITDATAALDAQTSALAAAIANVSPPPPPAPAP